ncbi:IucA/IucC family protein [Salinithrix halophila]|uniref:IucA/IucC family protein n=1 Tax=Salinithrix halophila TaxID=1485204 RepID=A0ABV8J9V2_9BACL
MKPTEPRPKGKTTSASPRKEAERAALRRLLNAWLRETGISDPRMSPGDSSIRDLPEMVWSQVRVQGEPIRIDLPKTGKALLGGVTWLSPFGHHDFGDGWWVAPVPGAALQETGSYRETARLIMEELAAGEGESEAARARMEQLLDQVENSVGKTARYLFHRAQASVDPLGDADPIDRVRAAEQSLFFGHPFHPTPKSSEGFSEEDLERFAPELGAAFPLRWFAIHPDWVEEAGTSSVPTEVDREAMRNLPEGKHDYRLIPVHPWQAEYLFSKESIQRLIGDGVLVDLGEVGKPVYPTSSVRTAWGPGHAAAYKMPLHVRITNFIRNNPPEHLRRSLDASRFVASKRKGWDYPGFEVLTETGYRSFHPTDGEGDLAADLNVLFREHPFSDSKEAPLVVASLLEEPVEGESPLLLRAVKQAGGETGETISAALAETWLRRYLEISMVPLLRVFADDGVSLEAHVQNSMLHLEEGWPVRFYVRDMEGVSLSRERLSVSGESILPADSPVLYPDGEAWMRLQYYFFTNHLGHLIHILARYGNRDEGELWDVVRVILEELRDQEGNRYAADLAASSNLPAKANLVSRFRERGEHPDYVAIPNPMREVSR